MSRVQLNETLQLAHAETEPTSLALTEEQALASEKSGGRPKVLSPKDSDSSDGSQEHDEDGEEEEDESINDFHFESDEAAIAARQEGLQAYNAGRYDDALDQQYRVVRYFSQKYGPTASLCGKYFLDYALSQLRVLQEQSSVEDALQPRDEEAMETCFINLEVARVAFQKQEAECGEEDVNTELSLAEVHNALAQLNVEREDYDSALREYEAELLIYRSLQSMNMDAVPPGRVVAVLYSIADCFVKEGDFAGAEERLQATLEEVARYPAGTIASELVDELKDMLEDAHDMKDGNFKKIQEEIQQQFAAEAEQLPTAQEFYGVVKDAKHPFVSAVPGDCAEMNSDSLSMPMSATGQILGMGEHSNSQSISLFPVQYSRNIPHTTTTGVVRHATVRKKPKNLMTVSVAKEALLNEPEAKRMRIE